ncbi:MAG TPA: hypothetical protein VNM22_10270 [Candidatus Limnocylindrales bacterium]|nr:hypothetical protein [Candidatus Limnocylindrales bacterium]
MMRIFSLATLSSLIFPLLFLNGCGEDKNSFTIPIPPGAPISSGILTANPGTVEAEGTSVISVTLESISIPPQNLIFNWSAQRGTITGNESTVLYQAPTTPGEDTVSVQVIDASSPVGTQVIATGNIVLMIIPRPTPTPTGSPTPSLTPSPETTPTPDSQEKEERKLLNKAPRLAY